MEGTGACGSALTGPDDAGLVLGATEEDLVRGVPVLQSQGSGQPPAAVALCPGGHELKVWVSDIDGYTCDACSREFLSGSTLHQCMECGYDECSQCVSGKVQAQQAAAPVPDQPAAPARAAPTPAETLPREAEAPCAAPPAERAPAPAEGQATEPAAAAAEVAAAPAAAAGAATAQEASPEPEAIAAAEPELAAAEVPPEPETAAAAEALPEPTAATVDAAEVPREPAAAAAVEASPEPTTAAAAEVSPEPAAGAAADALPEAAAAAAAEAPPEPAAAVGAEVPREPAAAVVAEAVLEPAAAAEAEQAPAAPLLPAGPPASAAEEGELGEAEDFSSEPLEARLQSKDLNRRCSAYAECRGRMSASPAEQEAFDLFWRHHAACLAETLPKGQDAALNAMVVYLDRRPGIENEASELLPLVRKLLEHKTIDKPKMQQLVPSVILALTEICECPAVMKEVMDCLTDIEGAKKKVQGFLKKQIAFIIKVIQQLLSEFGAGKMNPKLGYVGTTMKYVSDSDRGIRESCYSVLIELSAWVGDISDLVKPMEEPQKKELAKRIEGVPEDQKRRARPLRAYRAEALEAPDDAVPASSQPLDPHDFAEAVDALKRLPKGWCIEKIFSMEKWKEKQDHLQTLATALDVASLAPCKGYDEIVQAMKRMMKSESNIPVVTEAAKCVGLMARGLRREFERGARQLLPVMLARVNDKSVWKPNVLIERVEQLVWAVPFEVFFEELQPHIASKSAFVKKEAMSLLLRVMGLPQVLKNCPDAAQRFLAPISVAVAANADDSDSAVRREAIRCIASMALSNIDSPDVGRLCVDMVPASRLGLFEEEWRRAAGDRPCPAPPRGAAAAEPRARTPSRGRLAPRAASHGAEAAARGTPRSRPASPSRGASPAPLRRPSAEAPRARAASAPRAAASTSSPAAGAESETVREMAEEIRSLRSAVARLEAQHGEPRAPARPLSGRRSAAPQLRPASPGPARPSTPRRERPQREPLQGTPQRQARRLSAGSGCASPGPPPGRAAAAAGARGGMLRQGSSGTLPRQGSSGALEQDCEFEIEQPRQPKQDRQRRERNQYWGPGPIPAEYLAALRDLWKYCVEEHLVVRMFSDKLDQQLFALQSWKSHVVADFDSVTEVLDMLLKWLTWLLFNSNTQVWKRVLDILSCLLDAMAAAGDQLTDREAQILVPNLLERSGHNIAAIREVMQSLLGKLRCVCPRTLLLPMLLHGLASKNKRSVACVLKCLGDSLDRQAAASLLRAQRDVGAVLKMLEEKDADVRRGAVHVVASLSLHVDGEAFARVCKGLSPGVAQVVRGAAQRLAPAETPLGSPCGSAAPSLALPARPLEARGADGAATPRQAAAGRAALGRSPGPAASRPASPARRDLDFAVPPAATLAPVSTQQQVHLLSHGNREQFREACAALKERVKQNVTEADASMLAEGLVTALRFYLGHDEPTSLQERCQPVVDVLDTFCSIREWVRPLPNETLRRLLREHLRHLHNSSWTKYLEDGSAVLRTLNLSCVMLLSAMRRDVAYSLLLELATEESEVITSSLVLKCLRKLNKTLATARQPDQEVTGVMEVLRAWLQRAHARLAQGAAEGPGGPVDVAVSALMEGAKEVAASAQNASPRAVEAWLRQARGPEADALQEWLSAGGKENVPAAPGAPQEAAALAPKEGKQGASGRQSSAQRRRASSPAKLSASPSPARAGAPGAARNLVQ